MSALLALELPVCRALNRWGAGAFVRPFFALISRLGDGWIWYALMLVLPAAGGRRGALAALHLAVTGLLSLALYRWMKQRIRRPRPCASDRNVVARVAPLDVFSFPSGHTLHAVAFTVVATSWYPALAWLLLPFTVLVALSRVVLGLHYPSDVLAALVLGLALAATTLAAAGFTGLGPT